jgi:hypothetical protein
MGRGGGPNDSGRIAGEGALGVVRHRRGVSGLECVQHGTPDQKTGLASKRVVLTFVVECVIGGGFGVVFRCPRNGSA